MSEVPQTIPSKEGWKLAALTLVTSTASIVMIFYGVRTIALVVHTEKPDVAMYQYPYQIFAILVSLGAQSFLQLTFNLLALKMPIVPSSLPFLGHALTFVIHTPWGSMLQWHTRYGEILAFTLMGRTMVSLANPQHLKLALQSKISAVKKDVGFTYQPFLVILGKGIVTSEDKDWMKQRLKMSTALRVTILDSIPRITLMAVQRLMIKLDKAADNAASGERVDLVEVLRLLTLQVISNAFLSISFDESDTTFGSLYLPIVEECNTRVWHPYRAFCPFLPSWWQHWYRIRQLNTYVSNLIQSRWRERVDSGLTRGDILDVVLDAYEKEHSRTKVIPSSDIIQVRDEFKTFMLAGHETSASMMTWALYEMMANPVVMNEVTNESDIILGKDKNWAEKVEIPSRDKLAGLVYTEGALKESLRKYSVVPLVVRRVVSELDLGDFCIPAGTTLALNIMAVHHNPKYWPDPMSFNPKRFVDQKPSPFTFLPFLEGPRNCLGQHLSLLESKFVLALLTQRYNFRIEKEIVTTLSCSASDPRHKYIIPATPKDSLRVVVTRRSQYSE